MNETYEERLERLASIFKTLANPNRLAIFEAIRALPGKGSAGCSPDERSCVGMIGERFDLAPSTVSEHLKELRRAGLIRMTKKGRMVYCCVSPKAVSEARKFLEG
jgi:ArsR family transcriptional regulator